MLVVTSAQQSAKIEVIANQISEVLSQEMHWLSHNCYFSAFLTRTESDFAKNLKKVDPLLD